MRYRLEKLPSPSMAPIDYDRYRRQLRTLDVLREEGVLAIEQRGAGRQPTLYRKVGMQEPDGS